MKELIERLTAATGPSRELDRLIGDAVGAPMGYIGDAIGLGYARFTESLDAALTLVPKGWTTQIYGGGWLRDWTVTIRSPDIKYRRSGGGQGGPDDYVLIPIEGQDASGIQCKTAALALCIAALRAREQQP